MKWFGESWGAPICKPEDHAEAPVGEPCIHCEEPIQEGDKGIITPFLTDWVDKDTFVEKEVPYHYACFMRNIVGSLAHINKTCSCFGGTEEDPPDMTKREAAEAALKAYEENL